MFEDTKGVTKIRASKKNRQHNGQKKNVQKNKQRFTKQTHKTKDWITLTPLQTGDDRMCSDSIVFLFFILLARDQCKNKHLYFISLLPDFGHVQNKMSSSLVWNSCICLICCSASLTIGGICHMVKSLMCSHGYIRRLSPGLKLKQIYYNLNNIQKNHW